MIREQNASKNAIFLEIQKTINESQIKAHQNSERFVKLRENPPKSLRLIGIKKLPMLSNRNHVRENILNQLTAISLGYSVKNKHYHGIGIEMYMKIINSIDKPVAIYQYTKKGNYDLNNFIILTSVEKDGKRAIVPIEINNKCQYNNKEIEYIKIKSVYFKDDPHYIDKMLKQGKIKEVFAGSNSQKTLPMKKIYHK